MPAHKKKTTTSSSPESTSTITPTEPLKAENFHQYLRAEIRHATRAVMEEIMREELSHFLQAEWGESTIERKGYRNGFYTRDLMTTCGTIEDLNVPRDREFYGMLNGSASGLLSHERKNDGRNSFHKGCSFSG